MLNTPRSVLIEKSDLEENTIDDVLDILRREYEDEEAPEAPAAEEDTTSEA